MKGNFFLGNGAFELRDMEQRKLQPNEVRIRNMAAGVCGTDVHIYHGDKGSADVIPPVVLGHEYSGLVLEIGENVHKVKVGDHVCVDPNRYCGNCTFCLNGQKQLCEHLYAVGVNENGGFAQESIVPENQCFKLSRDVDWSAGAMAEPISCCLHGMDQIKIHQGDTVAIIGGGAIGLLFVQLCRLSGASFIVVSEPIAFRRNVALKVGADVCAEPSTVAETIAQGTNGRGVDVIIECSGSTKAAQQTIALARRGTRILFFAVPSPEAAISLPLFDVYQKELSIVGSFINPDTFERAVRLLNNHRLQTKPIITHTYPLENVEDAIQMQMSDESLKVMVFPNGKDGATV